MESSGVSDYVFILSGFPPDASELRKSNMLAPFVDSGGVASWLGPSEVLLVYRSDEKAVEARAIPTSLRKFSLADYPGDSTSVLTVAENVFEASFKPRRDVSVANRFIGTSLGIRIDSSSKARPKPRAPSPPREDAWD